MASPEARIAYVLGSLSSAERREFEAHLETCPRCREAVAEISGMPALLSRLDCDDVASIDDRGQAASAPPPLRPEVLTSLLNKVTWRRRRAHCEPADHPHLHGVRAAREGHAALAIRRGVNGANRAVLRRA